MTDFDAAQPLMEGDLFEDGVEQSVGGFALGVGEVVLAVGVGHRELGGDAVERVDLAGGGDDAVDGLPLEVGVAERGVDEDGARGEGAEDFVEFEGDGGEAARLV